MVVVGVGGGEGGRGVVSFIQGRNLVRIHCYGCLGSGMRHSYAEKLK